MNLCTSTITHFNWNKIKTFKFDFCTSQHNINVFCSASKCLNASVRECVCVRVQLSMANRIMHSHMNMASTDSFVGSTEIYWIRFCFVIAAVHLKTIRYFASMSDVDGRCVCLCYLVAWCDMVALYVDRTCWAAKNRSIPFQSMACLILNKRF